MATTKIIGYVLSLAGVAVVALNNPISKMLSFLGPKALTYTLVGGIILVVVGIALALSEGSSSKVKQAGQEVPIYEGEGKKRKIVGYQRAK